MGHALAEQRFGSYEDVKKLLDGSRPEDFYWRVSTNCERWEKCVISNGVYFE